MNIDLCDECFRLNEADFTQCKAGDIEQARNEVYDICASWERRARYVDAIEDELKSRGYVKEGYVKSSITILDRHCEGRLDVLVKCHRSHDYADALAYVTIKLDTLEWERFEVYGREA